MRIIKEKDYFEERTRVVGKLEELWGEIEEVERHYRDRDLYVHEEEGREEIEVEIDHITYLPNGDPYWAEWRAEVHIYAPRENIYCVCLQETPVAVRMYHVTGDFLNEKSKGFLVTDRHFCIIPAEAVHRTAWAIGRRTPWFSREGWTWEKEPWQRGLWGEDDAYWGCPQKE